MSDRTHSHGNEVLAQRYRDAAILLVGIPDDDEDPNSCSSPWELGTGRLWNAAKYALLALRWKRTLRGEESLTDDERRVLAQFDEVVPRGPEGQTRLNEIRRGALELLAADSESGLDPSWVQ